MMSGRRARKLASSVLVGAGAAGVAVGLCFAVAIWAIADPQTAAIGSTVATSVAVIVALAVGLIPWFIAQDDRKTRSTVIASRIAHDLEIALRTAAAIRDGVGHAAETADAKRIQLSAKRCLPRAPETLDETFDNLRCIYRVRLVSHWPGVPASGQEKTSGQGVGVGMFAFDQSGHPNFQSRSSAGPAMQVIVTLARVSARAMHSGP